MWGMHTSISRYWISPTDLVDSNHIPRPVASPHPTPARRPETRVRPQRLGGQQAERYTKREEGAATGGSIQLCFKYSTWHYGVFCCVEFQNRERYTVNISLVMGLCFSRWQPLVFDIPNSLECVYRFFFAVVAVLLCYADV
jgi:hypothetical protein